MFKQRPAELVWAWAFWVSIAVMIAGIAVLFMIIGFAMCGKAKADHGGPTFEHECPLPDGDPRGWPCTHTMPNGQQYIDWSYAYIDDRNYPMVPVEVP